MIKHFCDVCGKEYKPHGRIKRTYGYVEIEVMVTYKKVGNNGDICDACIVEAVAKGTATPKKVDPVTAAFVKIGNE